MKFEWKQIDTNNRTMKQNRRWRAPFFNGKSYVTLVEISNEVTPKHKAAYTYDIHFCIVPPVGKRIIGMHHMDETADTEYKAKLIAPDYVESMLRKRFNDLSAQAKVLSDALSFINSSE